MPRTTPGDTVSPDQFKSSEQFWLLFGARNSGTYQKPELLQLLGTGLTVSPGVLLAVT